MTLAFPLPMAQFTDLLNIAEATPLTLRRGSERSGSGDGRYWSARLHEPLWQATLTLSRLDSIEDGALINSKMNVLGVLENTCLYSPIERSGPASGVTTGLGAVTISGIRADRGGITLNGLPQGFVLTSGDMLSILHGSGSYYLGEFSEGGIASASGAVVNHREIRPYLPFGVTVGATVNLVRPVVRMMLENYTPYSPIASFNGPAAAGASLTFIQKP